MGNSVQKMYEVIYTHEEKVKGVCIDADSAEEALDTFCHDYEWDAILDVKEVFE